MTDAKQKAREAREKQAEKEEAQHTEANENKKKATKKKSNTMTAKEFQEVIMRHQWKDLPVVMAGESGILGTGTIGSLYPLQVDAYVRLLRWVRFMTTQEGYKEVDVSTISTGDSDGRPVLARLCRLFPPTDKQLPYYDVAFPLACKEA